MFVPANHLRRSRWTISQHLGLLGPFTSFVFPLFSLLFPSVFWSYEEIRAGEKRIVFITRGQRKRLLPKQAINVINFY